MDVREKLVELLDEAEEWADHKCDELDCETCCAGKMKGNCVQKLMVDRLIDHGVTVQGWISGKDRLPQEDEPEGATCEQVQVLLDNGVVSTGWCNRHTKLWWHLNYGETHFIGYDYEHTPVIAWQPLAQPPKGE